MAKISLDKKDFDKGIDDSTSKGKTFASKMGGFATGAVKAVGTISTAVGVALTAVGGFSIKNAMELEASEAKYKTVFGEFTETSDAFLKEFQKLTPATTAEARNMASGIQDMLVPLGFARDEATNMTGEFMHVIGALTNFNSGTETAESVTAKMTAALTGELDGLKSLGIQLDADTVRQKAVEMGLASTTKEVGKQEIAQVVLSEAYKQSGDALAAYNEESLDAKTRMGLLKSQISDVAAEMGSKFLPMVNEGLKVLKNGFESSIPAIEGASDGLLKMFQGVEGGGEQFKNSIKSLLDGLVESLMSALPTIMDVALNIVLAVTQTILESLPTILESGMQIMTSLRNGMAEAIPSLLETAVNTIIQLLNTFIENLPLLVESGINMLNSLIDGILSAIPTLIQNIPIIIDNFVNTIFAMLPNILQSGTEILLKLIEGIVNAIPMLIDMIPTIVQNFINTLTSNLPYIIETGVNLLLSLIDGILNALPQLITMTPQIIIAIVSTLISNLPQILKMGVEIIVKLISGLIQAIPKLVGAIPEIIGAMISTFTGMLGMFTDIGKNMIKGVWEGIKAMGSWITDKVKGFFGGIVDGVKSVLKIHSPSRLFRDEIGSMMAQGVGVGFTDEMDSVNADIEKSLNSTVKVASDTEDIKADNGIGQVVALLQQLLEKDTTIEMDGRTLGKALAPYKEDIDRLESRDIAFA